MKNLIMTLALVVASVLQLIASNAPKSSFLEVSKNEKSVILKLSGVDAQANFFTITNSEGDVLIKEDLDGYENSVKYNLSKLPIGSYTIKIIGDNFIETHETIISKDQVSIENTDYHFRPTMRVVDKRILVNTILSDGEEISMNIYNDKGDLVYNFNAEKVGGFQKSFNLEQLESGKYRVVVSNDYFSRSSDITL